MRRICMLLFSVFTCFVLVAWPQAGPRTTKVAPRDSAEPAVLTTEYFGRWYLDFTIQLYTSPASTDVVTCEGDWVVADPVSGYTETSVGVAAVSGSTATCTAVIPYLWELTSTSDTVVIGYKVAINHVYSSGGAVEAKPSRETDHTIGTFPVPPPTTQSVTSVTVRL